MVSLVLVLCTQLELACKDAVNKAHCIFDRRNAAPLMLFIRKIANIKSRN